MNLTEPVNPANAPLPVTVNGARPGGISRREAIQWVMGAVAASALPHGVTGQEVGRTPIPQEKAATQPNPIAAGRATPGTYGTDPNLVRFYKPGDLWPLTFSDAQKKTVAALADIVMPKDQYGPAASEVGVVEMVDEWISATYPTQQADRPVILNGLKWLEDESNKRFGKGFASLTEAQKHAICDDICFTATARAEHRQGAAFFSRFRSLCAAAYFATPPGWKAIGYEGNVALAKFDGPPPEVLQKLGVTQTVKEEPEA